MYTFTSVLAGLITIGLTFLPTHVKANCSCSPTGGSVLQGIEFIAKSCPEEGDNDDTDRVYISQWILCSGGQLVRNTMFPESEGVLNVKQILSRSNSYNNTKILRNESGTHIISVHRYYQGQVAGITPSVGVTTHENLNQYCTHNGNLPDMDLDGFPYCLDCDDSNQDLTTNCPTCDAQCALEKNLGPPCPNGSEK